MCHPPVNFSPGNTPRFKLAFSFSPKTLSTMLHERIKKIREYRGLKQLNVAAEMNITQQAYSWLETQSGNIKLETLLRYCDVMKVDLPFLMATDIPINAENMET